MTNPPNANEPEAPAPYPGQAQTHPPQFAPPAQPQYAPPVQPPAQPPKTANVLGIVAFALSIPGFVLACVPFVPTLILAGLLLTAAFVLAIVSLFQKGTGKGFGIAGLAVSVVGAIVGAIVLVVSLLLVFDRVVTESTSLVAPDGIFEEQPADPDQPGAARENPLPLGSSIESGDWAVSVDRANLDANAALLAEELNEPAQAGMTYILVDVTVTYLGDDAAGAMPMTLIDYISVDGATIDFFPIGVYTVPDELDLYSTLAVGASTTGKLAFEVPTESAGEGVLAVTPDVFAGETVFVAVR